jgi:hypothetical protein
MADLALVDLGWDELGLPTPVRQTGPASSVPLAALD